MTQLQLWGHGLATLVTPVGWYAHLPEGLALYVRPEHEHEDIQWHLEGFLKEPDRFYAIGSRAREFLKETHRPEKYAADLVAFAARYSISYSGARPSSWRKEQPAI